MFERYTEQARRTIFFARYEASQLRSLWIEPVHLLLGLLREDALLRRMLSEVQREEIRKHVEQNFMGTEQVSTSVDLPLSHPAKRALDRARDAADEAGGHGPIDSAHLLLGVLRIGDAPILELLQQQGIDERKVKERMKGLPPSPPKSRPRAERSEAALEQISDEAAGERLKRLPWTRKQAIGHLIDWAAAHHDWIGRALVEKSVVAHAYPFEDRVVAAKYDEMLWSDLVIVWLALNDLLQQIIARMPAERWATPCRIGIDAERTLGDIIQRYREYTADLLAQICTLGDVLP